MKKIAKLVIKPYNWYECINNYYAHGTALFKEGTEYEGIDILYNLPRTTPFERFFKLSINEEEANSQEDNNGIKDSFDSDAFIEKLSTKVAEKLAALLNSNIIKKILPYKPAQPNPFDCPVVMYGVQTTPTIYDTYTTSTSDMHQSNKYRQIYK